MVRCTKCEKTFEPLFVDNSNQAMSCSAEIFERDGIKYMIGCYGSKIVDGRLYKVLTDKYKKGIICDSCIEDNMQDFEILRDNQFFGIDL
jgi:hypothetical protein